MHTHTSFCDGSNTVEEMAISAIACGCKALGFSGHAPMAVSGDDSWTMKEASLPQYKKEVERVKVKYQDRLDIMLGIEQDYFSVPLEMQVDYVIGSVHCVQNQGQTVYVDLSPQELKQYVRSLYNNDILGLVKDYYSLVANVVDKTDCDIIGHFDLVTKFNEKYPLIDTTDSAYRRLAIEALDALISKDRLFEINTGALSRGWRTTPYPEDFILKRIAEKNANVIITSDAHSKDTILFGYSDAVEYAKACGITSICVYENKKIKNISI